MLVVTTSDFNLVIYNCDSNRQSPVISGVIPLDLTLPGKNMSSVMKIFYVHKIFLHTKREILSQTEWRICFEYVEIFLKTTEYYNIEVVRLYFRWAFMFSTMSVLHVTIFMHNQLSILMLKTCNTFNIFSTCNTFNTMRCVSGCQVEVREAGASNVIVCVTLLSLTTGHWHNV